MTKDVKPIIVLKDAWLNLTVIEKYTPRDRQEDLMVKSNQQHLFFSRRINSVGSSRTSLIVVLSSGPVSSPFQGKSSPSIASQLSVMLR